MKYGLVRSKLLMLLALSMTACASNWSWELVTNDNKSVEFAGLLLQLPDNWVIYNKHFNKYYVRTDTEIKEEIVNQLIISKSGLELDAIRIASFNPEFAFPSIGQSAGNAVLPSELAERFIAEQKAIADSVKINVSKNEPYSIAGQTGFRINYQLTNSSGIDFKHSAVGFTAQNNFYVFLYRASSIHYFEAGLPNFEALLSSVQSAG